ISWQYATDSMPETSEPVFKEITTPRGERANIQLGDGSKIILNSDSRLTMPEKFSHSRRIVKLKGQAFFEVAPNSTHPFIVVTNGMEVEVLGTSFDVSSYENDDKFHVAVSEGSVIFRNTERPEDHVQLNSGEVGIFSRTNAVFTKKAEEDLSMYMGWRTGRLIFKNASIVEVVNRIERWYDISIVLQMSEERRAEKKLTADLKTKSIRELMDVIRASTGLEYEMDDDHIILR
ncbi:MAG: FecR family protein, partial [Balneolaceae bacterium]